MDREARVTRLLTIFGVELAILPTDGFVLRDSSMGLLLRRSCQRLINCCFECAEVAFADEAYFFGQVIGCP